LIRGLPGSGKSTEAKRLVKDRENCVHIEADQFFMVEGVYQYDSNFSSVAHAWCLNSAGYHMYKGRQVVVANTFVTLDQMKPYFDLADKFGAIIEIVLCTSNFGSVHNVPAEVITKMEEDFEAWDHCKQVFYIKL
jgi:predicted kinase